MMDYEKAYKAVLKTAKQWIKDGCSDKEKICLECVFPELRESEDERIRKGLIEALKTSKTVGELKFTLPEPTREKCIAYLEKQKDASKAIEAVDRIDKYIDEHLANAHDMKDSNPDKKYYRGWDDALGKMAGILQDVYSNEKQKEQKPAEWSEEDEKIITRLIGYFESFRIAGVATKWEGLDIQEVITLLKSLRPQGSKDSLQTHWKPSEEQMEALQNAVALAAGNKVLAGLYEHLLKSYRI